MARDLFYVASIGLIADPEPLRRGSLTLDEALASATADLEESPLIDRLAPAMTAAATPFSRPPLVDFLRGRWLGHALHPLLTDIPLGCWIGAIVLDMLPGRRRGSQTLVGAGLAAVPMTLAAGLAEWETLDEVEQRRVATVHAIGNVVAAFGFLRSWQARRRDAQAAGVAWSLIGGLLALGTGYLGGHMSFVQRAGTGRR
jgi:uncharacterized membrane protein